MFPLLSALPLVLIILTGCGMSVPPLEFGEPSGTEAKITAAKLVRSIAGHVHCELRRALYDTIHDLGTEWLWDWSAQITLTLTVDEKSSLSPGLSLTKLLPGFVNRFPNGTANSSPQSLGIGFGAGAGADANRVESVTVFLDFKDLRKEVAMLKERISIPCALTGVYPIEGSLRIEEGLYAGVEAATSPGLVAQGAPGPLSVITHHVTFDVNVTGNVTPTWHLVNVAANTSGSLISGTRDRKDELLITMGPTEIKPAGTPTAAQPPGTQTATGSRGPSQTALNSHLAQQIGQAVATAIQATITAP
jgi:hypothetical protein